MSSHSDNGSRYDAEGFDRLLERRIDGLESREDSLLLRYTNLQVSADLHAQQLARHGISLFELREELRAAHLEILARLDALANE